MKAVLDVVIRYNVSTTRYLIFLKYLKTFDVWESLRPIVLTKVHFTHTQKTFVFSALENVCCDCDEMKAIHMWQISSGEMFYSAGVVSASANHLLNTSLPATLSVKKQRASPPPSGSNDAASPLSSSSRGRGKSRGKGRRSAPVSLASEGPHNKRIKLDWIFSVCWLFQRQTASNCIPIVAGDKRNYSNSTDLAVALEHLNIGYSWLDVNQHSLFLCREQVRLAFLLSIDCLKSLILVLKPKLS